MSETRNAYFRRRRALTLGKRSEKVREIIAALPQMRTQREVGELLGLSKVRVGVIEREVIWKIYVRCKQEIIND